MSKKSKKPMGKGNKFLLGLGVVVLLIALFFISFWVTTLSLRSGQEPVAVDDNNTLAATATPAPDVNYKKMSKKELIELLEKRDDRIEELEEALGLNSLHTQAPIDELGSSYSSSSNSVPSAKPSESPVEKTPEPVKTSEPKATATPKPAATPKPTATPKPVATPEPTPKPAEPTPAPATKAPSIKPVAPAADSE